jgi:hypothetical protein
MLTIPFLKAVLPLVSDPAMVRELDGGCLGVRIRGGPRFAVCYTDAGVRVEDGSSRRPDCHLSADPAAFFLVGTALMPLGKAIARGEFVAWGRRPWLAVQFVRSLRVP